MYVLVFFEPSQKNIFLKTPSLNAVYVTDDGWVQYIHLKPHLATTFTGWTTAVNILCSSVVSVFKLRCQMANLH